MQFTWLSILLLTIAAPAAAQKSESDPIDDRPPVPTRSQSESKPGEVAKSVVGQAGQRQTREDVAKGVAPMARINSRIQNRVESRIRNRIDRSYDPKAIATSPFKVAGEHARTAGRPQP